MSSSVSKKLGWRLWLGLIISVVTLGLAFSRVKWHELVDAIRQADLGFVLLGIACLQLNLIIRAWRWQVLLHPLGRFRFRDCFVYCMIGYMSNLVLPLRAGEIIRPYLFGQKKGVAKSAVFATVVVERLSDVICLLVMLAIVALVMDIPAEMRKSAYVVAGAAMVVFALLWGVSLNEGAGHAFAWLLKRFPTGIGSRLEGGIASATGGFATLHNVRAVLAVLLISIVMWLSGILVTKSYLAAFGLDLPWYAPVFVIVVSNLGMMIPSSPGFVGVAHFLYVSSLSVFGVIKSRALAFAIVVHGVSFAVSCGVCSPYGRKGCPSLT